MAKDASKADLKRRTAKEAARVTGGVATMNSGYKSGNVIGSSKGRVTGSNKIAIDYAVGNKRWTKNKKVYLAGDDRNTATTADKSATTKGRPRNRRGINKNAKKRTY